MFTLLKRQYFFAGVQAELKAQVQDRDFVERMRQPGHQGFILGYKRRLFGFIGLRWKQLWFLIHELQTAHQLGGTRGAVALTIFRQNAWADVQNPANRPGIFSSVQKKKRTRTFPNKGIYLAAAADRFKRYALFVGQANCFVWLAHALMVHDKIRLAMRRIDSMGQKIFRPIQAQEYSVFCRPMRNILLYIRRFIFCQMTQECNRLCGGSELEFFLYVRVRSHNDWD